MASIAAGGVQSKVLQSITREAKRDLSSYQYCAMKIDSDNLIDYADQSNGDIAIGVLQNAPDAAGKEAEVAILGTTVMKVDGNAAAINEGDALQSNGSYIGAKVTADKSLFMGRAMEPSTALNDHIEVMLVGGTQYIAA